MLNYSWSNEQSLKSDIHLDNNKKTGLKPYFNIAHWIEKFTSTFQA